MSVYIRLSENFDIGNPLDNFDADSAIDPVFDSAAAYKSLRGMRLSPALTSAFVKWREQLWAGGVQTYPYWSTRFFFRFPSALPSAPNPSIHTVRTLANVDDLTWFYNTATGRFRWDLDVADTGDSDFLVAAGQWYLIETKGSYAADPRTADVRINGRTQPSVSTAGNPADVIHEISWGPQTATQTWDGEYDWFTVVVSDSPLPFIGSPFGASGGSSFRRRRGALAVRGGETIAISHSR